MKKAPLLRRSAFCRQRYAALDLKGTNNKFSSDTNHTIPIIRVFDEAKAKEFYVNFPGVRLDWEHRFEDGFPIYMQVSKGNLIFHLSERSGDCTPGSKVFVNVTELDELFEEITSKQYKCNKPEVEMAPWGSRAFTVIDPFWNKVLFNEPSNT